MPLWSSFTPKKMAPTMRARKMLTVSCKDKHEDLGRSDDIDKLTAAEPLCWVHFMTQFVCPRSQIAYVNCVVSTGTFFVLFKLRFLYVGLVNLTYYRFILSSKNIKKMM